MHQHLCEALYHKQALDSVLLEGDRPGCHWGDTGHGFGRLIRRDIDHRELPKSVILAEFSKTLVVQNSL